MFQRMNLGSGRKPDIMPHYPHMMNEDSNVWTDFLTAGKFEVFEVWYDVHVGNPVPLRRLASQLEKKVAAGVTRKRIDVICTVKNETWIVEIKPHANMKALGQILTYERLFNKEYQVRGKVIPVILCDTFDQDLEESFEQFGVRVIINSPDKLA